MVEEFPGASHRAAAEGKAPSVPEKKVERITTGEAVQRKRPLSKRFTDTFVAGDARSVWHYVAMDVLIPAAKDMVVDGFMQGLNRMVYGDARRPGMGGFSGTRPSGPTGYTAYSGMAGTPQAGMRPDPRQQMSQRGRATHDFGEIMLNSRAEAEMVIDQLFSMISQYGTTSVADLYDMVGITGKFTDNKYGWRNLQGAAVVRTHGGQYLLDLPRPEPLD